MTADRVSLAEAQDGSPRWHAIDPAAVEGLLHTSSHGLSRAEVEARLAHHGPNQLEEEPPPPPLVVLARQFRSPLIYILVAATAVTAVLGEYIDASVIAAVLVVNGGIGFTQERKAEGAVRALMQLVVPRARVVRDGQEREIDSRDLVPGDVVLLEPGSKVPADLRLVAANGLQIDESLLTGESLPVTKRISATDEAAVLADRRNMAYTGAVVTGGRGRGVVVATGTSTELGAIAGLMRGERATETPLQRRLSSFAKVVGAAVGAASVVAFASGVALGGGAHEMFLTSVALAVSAVPEGLPVAVTITLAIGVGRMARRNAIVRRLSAVETLGSTTVIGSDKTGTLTQNRMTVEEVWADGRLYRLAGDEPTAGFVLDDEPVGLESHRTLHEVLLAGVLTNEAEVYRGDGEIVSTGDPTEVALLVAAMNAGIVPDEARQAQPPFAEIPFEPERRYSASVRERPGAQTVFVKGAPERVIDMCTHMLTEDGPLPVDANIIMAAARDLASRGLRVLAMAHRTVATPLTAPTEIAEPERLTFLGLQGMMDPPRPAVRESIAMCHEAGIRVVMITGDHVITARAIAEDLGIAERDAASLTGEELATIDDDELRRRVGQVAVFARVAPEDKLRIVRAFQDNGEVVAVTGDGVNDAPALKAAAIGIAMGRGGTDVAREASDMVLVDDNFVSITAAVEEGRVTFDNIRKVTFFLVSCGAAEVVAIVVSVWLQWPLLLLPAQLLWLNLVTNGLQDVALAFEPGESGVLRRRPRPPREGVLSRTLWERTALAGVVMAAGTLAMFRWELDRTDSVAMAQTVALTTLVVFQVFQAGNSRSESESLFRISPVSNPFLFVSTLAAVGLHVLALYLPPTQYILRVEPIGLNAWVRIVATASAVIFASEAHKLLTRRRQADTPT
jgi:magnesium-transporting ATPase (P-type)